MTDIVEHLRRQASQQDMLTCEDMLQGADEIERLNRYAERLRANAERDANEVEQLTNAIRRIDSLNAILANYSPAISAICDAILRPPPKP
jgi:hypothetical protein